MSRRILALMLAALMLAGLCACGGSGKDGPDEADEEPEAEATAEPVREINWAPDGDVKVIVAYEQGDINDIAARVLAQYAEKYIGRSIEIVDIPGGVVDTDQKVPQGEEPQQVGGAGAAGWKTLAESEPDGLTIGYIDAPGFCKSVAQGHGFFDEDDFVPLCTQEVETAVVVVREKDERFGSLEDLVSLAQEQPETLVAATDGEHGISHACTQAFARSAGFTYAAKHLSRPMEAIQALRTNQADFFVAQLGDIAGLDADLKVIGVFSEERLKEYPDAPTLAELGYYDQWLGLARCICAPAGVSDDVVAFYENAFSQAMNDPGYKSASTGLSSDFRDSEGAGSLVERLRVFTLGTAKHFW